MGEVGFARGNVSPIIYFENASGELMMPVYETGRPEQARRVYKARYAHAGWEWREADTLPAVDRLQSRLIDQEERRRSRLSEMDRRKCEPAREFVEANLKQRMISSSCSAFERDFIKLYLQLRDDSKRRKYAEILRQHQDYLWASAMDSSTKIEDRMKSEPGDFWRQT